MAVEQLEVRQETELDRALQIIREDTTLFPITPGSSGNKGTRLDVYNKLFSREARIEHYKNFFGMSPTVINDILEKEIVRLASAKVILHFASIVTGELIKAQKTYNPLENYPRL